MAQYDDIADEGADNSGEVRGHVTQGLVLDVHAKQKQLRSGLEHNSEHCRNM